MNDVFTPRRKIELAFQTLGMDAINFAKLTDPAARPALRVALTKAYRQASLVAHPDRNPDTSAAFQQECKVRMQALNAARDLLDGLLYELDHAAEARGHV